MYARVIVEIGVKAVDRLFTYLIPDNIKDKIKVGARVKVPFGKQLLEGFVLEISDVNEEDIELKEIMELVDEEPILNEEMLWLGREISKRTLCSLINLSALSKISSIPFCHVRREIHDKRGIFSFTSRLYFFCNKILFLTLLEISSLL